MSNKYLHRVRAYYKDGTVATRHFQTWRSAYAWGSNRAEGYPERVIGLGESSEWQPAIPPAERVTFELSLPIEWSENLQLELPRVQI